MDGEKLSIFDRVEVCNVFLFTKLAYFLQALHSARNELQTLHMVLATFRCG